MKHQPGTPSVPVTWSSCKPIHVVVNDAIAPPEGWDILMAALDQVHEASGLQLVVDGRTTALPGDTSHSSNGIDFDPVLIAWTTPQQAPGARGQRGRVRRELCDVGPGVRQAVLRDRSHRAGHAPAHRGATPLARADGVRAVIVHELGHVPGLAHVDDYHEVMY